MTLGPPSINRCLFVAWLRLEASDCPLRSSDIEAGLSQRAWLFNQTPGCNPCAFPPHRRDGVRRHSESPAKLFKCFNPNPEHPISVDVVAAWIRPLGSSFPSTNPPSSP